MAFTVQPLPAARGVESLLAAAKELLLDAASEANDARLTGIAFWIRQRVDSLDSELLKEVRATVEALEKRQTEEAEAAKQTEGSYDRCA